MTRIIDADELVPRIEMGRMNEYLEYGKGHNDGLDFAIARVKEQPTVDAIPVELLESHVEYLRTMADREFETNGGYFGDFHYRMYEVISILKMWEERKRYEGTD